MVKLNIDMSVDDIKGFQDVDAGKHRAKLTETSQEDSRSSGEPMICWDWVILEGDNEGRTIRSYTTLQQHALGGMKNHCAAFNYHGTLRGLDTDKFLNETAYLVVVKNMRESRETHEQIEVSNVKTVLPDPKSKCWAGKTPPSEGVSATAGSSKTGGTGKPNRKDDIPF